MKPSDSLSSIDSDTIFGSGQCNPAEMLATLGVTHEQFGRHQEQMRLSFSSPRDTSLGYQGHSLPFPLNLPPAYPTNLSTSVSATPTRQSRLLDRRPRASVTPGHVSVIAGAVKVDYRGALGTPSASCFKGKGKRTLDAFMDSRQDTRSQEFESSGSDSDTPLRQVLAVPLLEGSQNTDYSVLPPSSPPSSSPLRTPREDSPLHRTHAYSSSPTPRPKRRVSTKFGASDPPYTLPPGPYSMEKPSWSLAALIGQALTASHAGALPLNDIYSYISTVYPHYNRRDQPWMSSVRHSLSVNDAFERVPDQEGSADKSGRGKGKTRLKGGLWRIKPGHETCFAGGNFVRKGAKGPGPGKNLGGRKRLREEDGEHNDKKPKGEQSSSNRSSPPDSNSMSPQSLPHTAVPPLPSSSSRTIYSAVNDRQGTPVSPTLRSSSSMSFVVASPTSPSDPFDLPPSSPVPAEHGSSDLPLALMVARRNAAAKGNISLLEPGFEFTTTSSQGSDSVREADDMKANRDLFTRVLASTSSAHAFSSQGATTGSSKTTRLLFPPPIPSSSLPSASPAPVCPKTPPPHQPNPRVTLSPVRTPMSHQGLHMSPSRSLAHYKSSFDPEWKVTGRRTTPPPRDPGDAGDETILSTPQRLIFSSNSLQVSPFRTPARPSKARHRQGYDPYDPNTVLADELASIRHANEPQDSPGGFFGKEGRKLLYESPSVPGQSNWRFRDEF